VDEMNVRKRERKEGRVGLGGGGGGGGGGGAGPEIFLACQILTTSIHHL